MPAICLLTIGTHRILIGYQGLSNLAAQLKKQVLTKHMEVTKMSNLLLEEKKKDFGARKNGYKKKKCPTIKSAP